MWEWILVALGIFGVYGSLYMATSRNDPSASRDETRGTARHPFYD